MTLPRLPWQRSTSGDWFVAYPDDHPDHAATVRHMPQAVGQEKWQWSVFWEGRFGEFGMAADRQAAADAATEAWHRLIETTKVPRDVVGEIDAMLDRLSQRIPAGLLEEDTEYLHKVLNQIRVRWETAIRLDRMEPNIKRLMEAVSAELYRRRTGI
ncbi:hypothetical protein GCM10007989_04730 [Devosia pacifica]|uniref:Uncharacterized protein n=1 Tax=Devosia pacifica TaxID=1335967 RepID=A0A918RW92_9HYPH|nr:hypothetical protein [Devosia pacifica]GHA13201.1 hypothetical protein GCM10007989_04730 [Devosia pacifica]